MNRLVKSMVLAFCLLPLLGYAAPPDIVLKDFEGKDVNVNQYIGKGKWTVVVVWAHDCHVCNQEIHEMVFFHDEHKKKNAAVLGVSIDGMAQKQQAADFVKRHTLDFPNLIAEPEQAVMQRFGAGAFMGTPTYYVYGPDGSLQAKNVGAVTQEDIEGFIQQRSAKQSKTN